MNPILPPPLEEGDTIALVAPASWCDGFERTKEALLERGFQVKLPLNRDERFGYFAGTDVQRAEAFMEAWKDPDVKAIWCMRGGYGSGRILDFLDYGYIRENPKIFIGMSDITALHIALTQNAGIVSFLGPVAKWTFDPELETEFIEQGIWDIIKEGKSGIYPNPLDCQTLVGGKGEGSLVGGNLALICAHIGTKWQLDTAAKILLLEDVGEKVYRIDRMLNQMKQAGMLEDLAGVVLASWNKCEVDENDGWTAEKVCQDYFSEAPYPVIFGFPSGHIESQVTLPLNCRYVLDGDTRQLELLAPGVTYTKLPQNQSQFQLKES